MSDRHILLADDPLWYKDAIIYELHIKAFFDSDADGIGDFKGLTSKLDYLKDLGITAIWLLPFYPSPLKDDGYDISDYFDVHPDYGTLKDFREFLYEAHKRGLRVITELVLNHTSDQHAWFQRARRSKPGSAAREFYVWSDTPEKYTDARIIFQDFEPSNWTWDPVAKAYFWHRFYSHQPDLNFDNPQVHKALFKVIDFWMKMGVDGVRLDAIPYLYEREGTNCENLPETYEFLKKLRSHVDRNFKNKMLLAEANQWPEDAVEYFGEGDACHMAFHFPLMPRMFMAIQMEDNFPIIDILDQTPRIPGNCQWALFLRNHDELTLEMVTDEERDYMYHIYARDPRARINLGIRRRLAPLLEKDMKKAKLLHTMLFTLPGTPVIYYGDELGMGDNYYLGDRDGVRTPMQWSPDKNAGFSRANPHQLYLPVIIDFDYHYTTVNIESQLRNPSSFLVWVRHFIGLRKHFKVFGRGSFEIIHSNNRKIFVYVREYEDERILVAVNLSRHPQVVALDVSRYAGLVPEEMFSRGKFLPVREEPYVLTFAPYGTYLFLLKKEEEPSCVSILLDDRHIEVAGHWTQILHGDAVQEFKENAVIPYMSGCRWFGGKARKVLSLQIEETIPVGREPDLAHILLLRVHYTEGLSDLYVLPITYAAGAVAEDVLEENPQAAITRVSVDGQSGIIYDAVYNQTFCSELLSLITRRKRVKARDGELVSLAGKALRNPSARWVDDLPPKVMATEQSNTSILYGDALFLKIFRHPDAGINPDLEISRFLTERAGFRNIPVFAGGIEYRRKSAEPITLGILVKYIPNSRDTWQAAMDNLKRYYENLIAKRHEYPEAPEFPVNLLDAANSEIPAPFKEAAGELLIEMTSLLGRRTAEMHLSLAANNEDSAFKPEPFSLLWQRSVFQSMQGQVKRVFRLVEANLVNIPEEQKPDALEILRLQNRIIEQMRAIVRGKFAARKIRIHGDYHLGQVLYTGKDFIIIDFEGEPVKTLTERRLKRSPLRDVAGMIRSFHYAAYQTLYNEAAVRTPDKPVLEKWADLWYRCVSGVFLKTYFEVMEGSKLIPQNREDVEIMLRAFLLDKAVYEIGYELNNRPKWVSIPIRGIRQLME